VTDYSGLGGLVDQVVEAAIDATMRLNHWIPDGSGGYTYVRGEGDTVHVPGPHGGDTGDVQIGSTMPAGTDAAIPVVVNPSKEVYGPWREAVTEAFKGWTQLPDPAAYQGVVDRVNAGTERLSAGGDTGSGQTSQGGNTRLAATMTTIVTELAPFNGDTIDAFSKNYVNRFQYVAANQCTLGASLTVALSAEQKIWTQARGNIVTIAQQAKTAFEQSAHGGGDVSTILTVLGMLASAAGLVLAGPVAAPAGVTAAVSGAGSVIGILKDAAGFAPKEHSVPLGGGTPNDVLGNLRKAIKALSDDINAEEERIANTMSDVLSAATAHDGEFNLARPDRFFHETDPTKMVTHKNEIALEPKTLTKIGLTYMPYVASELKGAATQLTVDQGASMWDRPADIGRYFSGPAYDVASLSDHLVDILVETAGEVEDAGERLDIAARAFTQTDAQVHQALAEQSKRLDKEEHDRYVAEHPPPHMMGGPGRMNYI
jgi:hypothetical protein